MGFVTRSFVARAEREKQHCTRQPRSSLTVYAGRGGGRVGGGDGGGGGWGDGGRIGGDGGATKAGKGRNK